MAKHTDAFAGLKLAPEGANNHPAIHVVSPVALSAGEVGRLVSAFRATHFWLRDGTRRFALVRIGDAV